MFNKQLVGACRGRTLLTVVLLIAVTMTITTALRGLARVDNRTEESHPGGFTDSYLTGERGSVRT